MKTSIKQTIRHALITGPNSFGQRARNRRSETFGRLFPDLAEMSVLDLGGTAVFWKRAPARPKSVHMINTVTDPDLEPGDESWLRLDVGDACDIPTGVLDPRYDLVYSNSLIEHVGGHSRRMAFAEQVRTVGDEYWVQTPYRYFPVEPHWVAPGMQFLPLWARAKYGSVWPLADVPEKTFGVAVEAQLWTELLDISAMRWYFPDAEMYYERLAGLVKSVTAVKVR